MWRRLADNGELVAALSRLGVAEELLGNMGAAREALEEGVTLARKADAKPALADTLMNLGILESVEHNYERSLEILTESVSVTRELGDQYSLLQVRHNLARRRSPANGRATGGPSDDRWSDSSDAATGGAGPAHRTR